MAAIELVYGTTNAEKIGEVQRVAQTFGIRVIDLKTALPRSVAQSMPEVSEIYSDYAGNAARKALVYAHGLQRPCLADDAGLEVEELGQLPGVYTARFGFERVQRALTAGRSYDSRFVCCVAYAEPGGRVVTVTAPIAGRLVIPPRTEQPTSTLPYSHFFIPDGYTVTMATLVRDNPEFLSHRGRAVKALLKALR